MTGEKLLIQRYKVIAPYPCSRFEVGNILHRYNFETSETGMYTYTTNLESPLQGCGLDKKYVETMPHLFKPLQWWEDQKPEDMPEYLEWDNGVVCKPNRYKGDYFYLADDDSFGYHLKHVSIATKEEYDNYIRQNPQQ